MSSIYAVDLSQALGHEIQDLLLEADPNWQQVQDYLVNAQLYAMSIDAKPIAEICLVPYRCDEVEIKNLSVDEQYQGRGFAKQLIKYAIDIAIQQNLSGIWVKTGNSSLDQLALYQKMGFRMQHIEKDIFLNYPQPIYENGIRCLDQVALFMSLKDNKK
ncbi:GNAT family N-acetyltransferase [Acinetobacter rudis]|uniref:GNAT family N-acetyltransferase n=1 Tax=Acinetobacter rudis TaxID=632955 RepID=A0AAW8J5X0_9GAMM|nr:GNAT family N-acetyltransferase [Acinetobacter rudis]MDQ8935472.1 GNAT family N-acetyltransferase [Acinetobacter rudis]MDQ8953546.1 GNAT family N-acetyltransferase [Acinetobacter rudis]MDQ9017761.1 GNAT family N-acetyltransferase [Acinetobacter rudis]